MEGVRQPVWQHLSSGCRASHIWKHSGQRGVGAQDVSRAAVCVTRWEWWGWRDEAAPSGGGGEGAGSGMRRGPTLCLSRRGGSGRAAAVLCSVSGRTVGGAGGEVAVQVLSMGQLRLLEGELSIGNLRLEQRKLALRIGSLRLEQLKLAVRCVPASLRCPQVASGRLGGGVGRWRRVGPRGKASLGGGRRRYDVGCDGRVRRRDGLVGWGSGNQTVGRGGGALRSGDEARLEAAWAARLLHGGGGRKGSGGGGVDRLGGGCGRRRWRCRCAARGRAHFRARACHRRRQHRGVGDGQLWRRLLLRGRRSRGRGGGRLGGDARLRRRLLRRRRRGRGGGSRWRRPLVDGVVEEGTQLLHRRRHLRERWGRGRGSWGRRCRGRG